METSEPTVISPAPRELTDKQKTEIAFQVLYARRAQICLAKTRLQEDLAAIERCIELANQEVEIKEGEV